MGACRPVHTQAQDGLSLSPAPLKQGPLQPPRLSHQPVCWNLGSHLADRGIWDGARDQAKEAYQIPRTRAFSSLTHFVYSLVLHLLCLD